MKEWYELSNVNDLDSPALVIYRDRVEENIRTLTASIDDITRLRPHVKTHKSPHVTRMLVAHGVKKFKCATVAEAEMLAGSGAQDVLLAYQPVGPKVRRFLELVIQYPGVTFACLIDNAASAKAIASAFAASQKTASVYVDLNVGMNRTGIRPEAALELINECAQLHGLTIKGLHCYDGHIRDENFSERKRKSDSAFEAVTTLKKKVFEESGLDLIVVAGGTPTYSIHSRRRECECSPGTFIYWDKGYEKILQEQHYLHAAVVITRIISKPAANILCADLGHKSIASENPIAQRVYFINAPDLEPIGHSEEHLVLRSENADKYNVGDILYGIPYHVCPTIALYEGSAVATGGKITDWWTTISRNRKITV